MKMYALFFLLMLAKGLWAERIFVDRNNNKISIPTVPQRVIVTSPEAQEIVFALGSGSSLVGNIDQCDFPEEGKKIQKVGDFKTPQIEKIIQLHPDLIITTDLIQKNILNNLSRLHYPLLNIYIKNLSDLRYYIKILGDIFQKKDQAHILIKKMNSLKIVKPRKNITILPLLWAQPIMTAGRDTLVDDIIQSAGAENLCHAIGKNYFTISEEFIIKNPPDYLLLLDKNINIRDQLKVVLKKYPNIKIINSINPDYIVRAGPRTILGIQELNNIIISHQDPP